MCCGVQSALEYQDTADQNADQIVVLLNLPFLEEFLEILYELLRPEIQEMKEDGEFNWPSYTE